MSVTLVLVLVTLCGCIGLDLPRTGCTNTINIDGVHFKKMQVLPLEDAYPSDAHYDIFGNLFYVQTSRNFDGYFFDIYILKFNTSDPVKIVGIPKSKGYSVAVDKKDSQVYFGTENGIYRYDYVSQSSSSYGSILSNRINMIFVDRDSNKYITEPNDGLDELYLLENNKKIPVSNINVISDMGIDDTNDIYFIKENQLFLLKEDYSKQVLIMEVPYSGTGQISFDGNGNVFIATDKLRYFHRDDSKKVNVITGVPGQVTALAFDKNGDFVLGLQGRLMKYKKSYCYLRY